MWTPRARAGLCILTCTMIACIILMSLGMFKQRIIEGFQASQGNTLTNTAYAMMDERCWLNANVVAANALGMVRHPTDVSGGACVVRGAPPGNGLCDNTNSVLFNKAYVQSVGKENIEKRTECVVRMSPTLSDEGAHEYADALDLNDVLTSAAYLHLMQQYQQGIIDTAKLRVDLAHSREETDTANNNWRTQTANDAAALDHALSDLRAKDEHTFQESMHRAAADRAQALSRASDDRNRALADAAGDRDRALNKAKADNDKINADWQQKIALPQMQEKCAERVDAILKAAQVACAARQPTAPNAPDAVPCSQRNRWVNLVGNMANNNDLKHSSASNMRECQERCTLTSDCTHIVYEGRPTEAHECWLKSGDAVTESNNWWSGISGEKYYPP